jgi:5'-nucleotidase
MKRVLLAVLFLAACTSSVAPPPKQGAGSPPAAPVKVVVVGTTDVHGWYNGHDETGGHYGGLPLFAGYVDALRAANPGRVIVVDSGDLFQGTLDSNYFEGEPVVKGYNAIGYAAAAVGNHEFDYGPVGPDAVARTADQDPLGALKRNASIARFPFLSANLTEKATGRTPSWAKAYTMVSAGGAKVGIIGLSTPDTPNVTMPDNVRTLDFGDPVDATVRAARELRAQGADAVIVIAHMGGRCRVVDDDPHDPGSCEKEQEVMRYLARLPKGTIDAYFAGHTHQQMRHYIADVPVSQGLAYSREFSSMELTVDPSAHRVTASTIRPLTMICPQVFAGTETCDPRRAPKGAALVPRTFEGRTIAPDAGVAAVIQPYVEKVRAKRNEPLGIHVAARIGREYGRESPLGDLLADAWRAAVPGADAAFFNSGGLRTDLRPGDLVYSDVFDVIPFDNLPATVTMTGAQLTELLRVSGNGAHGVLQTSGIRYTLDAAKDSAKPPEQRNRLVSVTLADGRPLDPDALYRVLLPDFVVSGGEGTGALMKSIPPERIVIDYTRPIREIVIDSLKRMPQPLVPKTDGRLTVLHPKESTPD